MAVGPGEHEADDLVHEGIAHDRVESAHVTARDRAEVAALRARLARVARLDGNRRRDQVRRVRASAPGRRWLHADRLAVDRARVERAERRAGKHPIVLEGGMIAPASAARAVVTHRRLAAAWAGADGALRLPGRRTAATANAHIAVDLLAHGLKIAAERAAGHPWAEVRRRLEALCFVRLSSPDGRVIQSVEPSAEAGRALESLGIAPPRLLWWVE